MRRSSRLESGLLARPEIPVRTRWCRGPQSNRTLTTNQRHRRVRTYRGRGL